MLIGSSLGFMVLVLTTFPTSCFSIEFQFLSGFFPPQHSCCSLYFHPYFCIEILNLNIKSLIDIIEILLKFKINQHIDK